MAENRLINFLCPRAAVIAYKGRKLQQDVQRFLLSSFLQSFSVLLSHGILLSTGSILEFALKFVFHLYSKLLSYDGKVFTLNH